MAYCTVAQVKTYLDITGSGDDALLGDLIESAQFMIDNYTHRTFEADTDETKYVDAVGDHVRTRSLFIDHIGDLVEITTIVNGDGITVSSDEYVTIPRNKTPYYGIKLLTAPGKYWDYATDYEDAIAITGKWGYSTTPPPEINHACKRLVAYLYRQKDAGVFDVTAIPEAGVIQIPQGFPVDVAKILKPYVRL